MDKYKMDRLESLSKINLTDEEKETALNFFDFWIEKFDMLENINTENIEPLISVSSLVNVTREDVAGKTISRETLLENTPETYDGYIVVPRILE